MEYYIYTCGTTILYYDIYVVITMLYKFTLHGIGLILAFLTRKVYIDVLNDYKCTVTTVCCSTVVLFTTCLVLLVSNNLNQPTVVLTWSLGIFIFGCTYLSFTFIPKVCRYHFYKHYCIITLYI